MEPVTVYPLFPDMAERVRMGEARSLFRGPLTVAEVLERGRDAMSDSEPPRPRRRLIDVILGR